MKMDKIAGKRLLIVSHNCLSKTGSNGRTLSNYLVGWDKSKIAQFYIHAEKPDFDVCENYFCITDKSVMKSVLKHKPAGSRVLDIDLSSLGVKKTSPSSEVKTVVKNSGLQLVREIAWMSSLWNKKNFEKWVDEFEPQVILFQAGDSAFLFRLVRKLSKKYNIPVVIYNTEGYYFKNKSFMQEKWYTKPLYPILHRMFCKQYKKLLKCTKKSIYNCDLLCQDYNEVFGDDGAVVMNTSEFTDRSVDCNKQKSVIYAGNLGLSRHEGLIEFANALKKVDSEMVLTVYGKAPTENVKNQLEECDAVDYRGLIPYEELQTQLMKSRYLLHVESFSDFYKNDLKYAFSTKIADSLASGSCLFVYAPENMAVCQYLKGTDSAVLINDKSELEGSIRKVLSDTAYAENIGKNGRALAVDNHNILKNRASFQKILQED